MAGRPLPSIGFNFFGAGGRGADAATVAVPFMVDTDAPALPSSVTGGMTAMNTITVNVGTQLTPGGRELSADFLFAGGIVSAADVEDLADRWSAELAAIVDVVTSGEDPGRSPSDVPGSGVTQADLDVLAERHPGAPVWPLSALQKGLYLQSALSSGAGTDDVDVYVSQAVLRLGGDVDESRLRAAVESLVAHHRVLRSGFVQTDGGAVVAVVP
ncbi:hypothetical protein G3I15_49880, partial [Streptomyces sp. SID10244]|nr:hypothetical protein [Streptomyces sp. SID10244]